MRSSRLTAFLLTAVSAWGACSSLGSGRWHCPDQGSATTNGSDFYDLLESGSVACGDKIILYASVEYHVDVRDWFHLKPQTGCGSKKTEIISNRLSEIPLNQKRNLKNYRALMPWLTTGSVPLFRLCAGSWGTAGARCANNYAFRGLYMSNDTASLGGVGDVGVLFSNLGVSFDTETDVNNYGRPNNIELDRFLMENREAVVYGDPTPGNADANAWITNIGIAIGASGDNWYVHDGYAKLWGYSRSGKTWQGSITGTAANPARLHSTNGTNLTTRLGITTGTYIRLVVRGGTGNWAGANGLVAAVGRADGDIDLYRHFLDKPPAGPGAAIDGSGFGASAGTIELIVTLRDQQYAFLANWGTGFRVIDNYMSSHNIVTFAGGGSPPLLDPAVIQSGSTMTTLNLDHVRGLKVGDLVAIDVPDGSPISTYCPVGSGQGCEVTSPPQYDGRLLRKGLVTAINGTAVTVRPWHISGIDIAPKIGGRAWWKSIHNEGLEMRGNEIDWGYGTRHDLGGKGMMEIKDMKHGLVDGNVMGGYLDDVNGGVKALAANAHWFIASADQNGVNPDHRVEDFHVSNNLAMGADAAGVTEGCAERNIVMSEYYQSINLGKGNVLFEHNLLAGCYYAIGGYTAVSGTGMRTGSGYRHETKSHTTSATAQGTNYLVYAGDCKPFHGLAWDNPSHPEYYQNLGAVVKDSILAHGLTTASSIPSGNSDSTFAMCWPGYATEITNNAVQVTNAGSPANQAALDAILPGNTLVTDMTNFYAGTCKYDSWRNCRLHASNPLRGTASDGGDPGADVDQIDDRLHRWSERAGLLQPSLANAAMIRKESAFAIGSTRAAITFQLFTSTAASGCTLILYTNRNRVTEHGDTDTSGEKLCNRAGNVVDGQRVTFVLGGNTALTASTTYFYKIADGSRVMVGEFTTAAAGSGTYNYTVQGASDSLTYSANADLSSGTTLGAATSHTVAVASGAVRYWRRGSTGARGVWIAR